MVAMSGAAVSTVLAVSVVADTEVSFLGVEFSILWAELAALLVLVALLFVSERVRRRQKG